MSGKLLDTNAVIALQKANLALLLLLENSDDVFVPATVIGELYYGAYNSLRIAENIRVIDDFVSSNKIIDCNFATGKIYGEIRHSLKIKGEPIPENDLWIAAIALQYDHTLVTQDAHFAYVDGLKVESW
jgi:tRNA(fMet)-specific endonuclease VapC